MKIVKGIGLFLIYPGVMLGLGFLGGASFVNYFYPGKTAEIRTEQLQNTEELTRERQQAALERAEDSGAGAPPETAAAVDEGGERLPDAVDVASLAERTNADTKYVLEETDVRNNTVVETTWNIPGKYIGLDREQFIEAMEEYEAFPPLTELERGFVSLEVLSFSPDKVVVRMNYEYTQPSSTFYLVAENNYVVVYLDDRETIYMYTDILLSDLPDNVQQDIINVMFVPDEEKLYDFLEAYSS